MGLRLGIEAMEKIAYEEANTKNEYFKKLDHTKDQIKTDLRSYFANGCEEKEI